MNELMDRICGRVVSTRDLAGVPPGFAGRVMAHVRERAEAALEGWFMRRVALPLIAGGGVASLGLGLVWMQIIQSGYAAELSMLIWGNSIAGY